MRIIDEAINRILGRLRKPITDADTADVPATARDEVEVILGSSGPLALHEIIAQNTHDHRTGLARLWSPEALEAGLAGLLTDDEVVTIGATTDPAGEHVAIFAVAPDDDTELWG